MTEHAPGGVAQRDAQVALDAELAQHRVGGKGPLQVARMVRDLAASDLLARRAGEVVLDVLEGAAAPEERERADAALRAGELGEECVGGPDPEREVRDERREEGLSGRARRAFGQPQQHVFRAGGTVGHRGTA